MLNTPGSGGLPSRPRRDSVSQSEGDLSGKGEEGQALRETKDVGSDAQLDGLNDLKNSSNIEHEDGSSKSSYGHNSGQQHLPSPRATIPQEPIAKSDSEARTKKKRDGGKKCADPPITRMTLSELDVSRIVSNPKLRHDVNFDPDLHYRPNLDGDSGRRKTQKANDFWKLFQKQLEMFMQDPNKFEVDNPGHQWCLPLTLQVIIEILQTLVPPEDRPTVQENLHVEHLLQQFRKGNADLDKLAQWLSRTLKSHCAPMRDVWVDEVESQICAGYRQQDVAMLVQGLQTLLAVLEAMKLDVANHQIRCLRPLLIQDTVEFERTFYMKKISLGKIDATSIHSWYKGEKSLCTSSQPPNELNGDMWVFFVGFAKRLLPSNLGEKLPDSFGFDEERFSKMRYEMLDAINLEVCTRLHESFQSAVHALENNRSTAISRLPQSSTKPLPGCKSLASSKDLPFSSVPIPYRKAPLRHPMHVHQARQSISDCQSESEDDDTDSDSSSSTTSRSGSFSSTTSSRPSLFSRREEPQPATQSPQDLLQQSILALLEDLTTLKTSTQAVNRWHNASPSIALQLLRAEPSTLPHLPVFESKLRFHLSNTSSPLFKICEQHVLSEFLPLLADFVGRFEKLSSTKLFEVAARPRPSLGMGMKGQREWEGGVQGLRKVAKQVAHLGVLHWRVWAELCYLVDPDEVPEGEKDEIKGKEEKVEESKVTDASGKDDEGGKK